MFLFAYKIKSLNIGSVSTQTPTRIKTNRNWCCLGLHKNYIHFFSPVLYCSLLPTHLHLSILQSDLKSYGNWMLILTVISHQWYKEVSCPYGQRFNKNIFPFSMRVWPSLNSPALFPWLCDKGSISAVSLDNITYGRNVPWLRNSICTDSAVNTWQKATSLGLLECGDSYKWLCPLEESWKLCLWNCYKRYWLQVVHETSKSVQPPRLFDVDLSCTKVVI